MSDTTDIRDRIVAILTSIQAARGWTAVRITQAVQLDENDCPIVTVLIGDDAAQADDDCTVGPPHFVHETSYHVSSLRAYGTEEALDDAVTVDADAIHAAVLCDPTLNSMIEGVPSMRTQRVYPTGPSGTLYVELRFEITVQYRTLWNPVIPDAFNEVDMTSKAPLPTDGTQTTGPFSYVFKVPS